MTHKMNWRPLAPRRRLRLPLAIKLSAGYVTALVLMLASAAA